VTGDGRVAALEEFLARRGGPLLRAAALLGGGPEAGEDLLQAALERMLRHWHRVEGDPEGYLRRTIYHLAADGWRRQRRWRERLPLLHSPGASIVPDSSARVEQRDELFRLLLQLPPRQRAAVMLRYWEDLNEAEAAQVLGCSPGTVKSAASRGLARLRELGGTPSAAAACQERTTQR
jgi:RNA polymerase sigma-70 factor (sigma-E family)